MARVIITVSSPLFDEGDQEVSLQPNVTIHDLMTSAVEEFRLPPGNYHFYDQETSKRLEPERTIEQLGIPTGSVLMFQREEPAQNQFTRAFAAFKASDRKSLGVVKEAPYVREVETRTVFRLRWQPALIGRPDANSPDKNRFLAVDLEPFPNARSVSRNHASITNDKGVYYLESLAARNPTLLNGEQLTVGEKYPLKQGDMIQVGQITLEFHLPEMPAI